MEAKERERQHVLQLIASAMPERFWIGYQQRAFGIYKDAFRTVSADPQLNKSQRLSKLWQERHFRMEWLLIDEAKQDGIPASDTLINENQCVYALAGQSVIKLTQKYVQACGQMPSPARFRTQLAAVNAFNYQGRLSFEDEPQALVLPSQLNGIVLHSPLGKAFTENDQSLGSIGLYVPYGDFKGWAFELPFAEIISAYQVEEKREDRVKPSLRVQEPKRTGSEK